MPRVLRLAASLLVLWSCSVRSSLRPVDTDSLVGGSSTPEQGVLFAEGKIRGPLARTARRGIQKLGRNVTKSVRRIGRRTGLRLLEEAAQEPELDSKQVPRNAKYAVPGSEFLQRDSKKSHHKHHAHHRPHGEAESAFPPLPAASVDNDGKVSKKQRPKYVGQTTVVMDESPVNPTDPQYKLRRLQTVFTPTPYAQRQMPFEAPLGLLGPTDPLNPVASLVAGIVNPLTGSLGNPDDWMSRGVVPGVAPLPPTMFDNVSGTTNGLIQALAVGPQALLRGTVGTGQQPYEDPWGLGGLGEVLSRNANNLLQVVGAGVTGGLGAPTW